MRWVVPGFGTLPGRRSRPPLHLLEQLGRKWDVQPGRLLGTATFMSFSGSLKGPVMVVGRWG